MKEDGGLDSKVTATWTNVFNALPLSMRIKAKDVSNSLITVMQESASNLTLALDLIAKNKFINLNDLEMDLEYADWFTDLRRLITQFKSNLKAHYERLGTQFCGDKGEVITELFSPRRTKVVEKEWGFEDNRDIRKKVEDVLLTILPMSFKREHIPDDKTCDFKVDTLLQDKSYYSRR